MNGAHTSTAVTENRPGVGSMQIKNFEFSLTFSVHNTNTLVHRVYDRLRAVNQP